MKTLLFFLILACSLGLGACQKKTSARPISQCTECGCDFGGKCACTPEGGCKCISEEGCACCPEASKK